MEGKNGYDCSNFTNQPNYYQVIQHFQKNYSLFTSFLAHSQNQKQFLKLYHNYNEAVHAVDAGRTLLVIDDTLAYQNGNLWLDPHLITSAIDQILVQTEKRRD